jgi:hypothetical protein
VDALVARFEHCFITRTRSPDPAATPKGCATPASAPPAVARAFAAAGRQGQRQDFLHSFERTLLFEVVVFGLAALLVGFVPRVEPTRLGHGPPTAE